MTTVNVNGKAVAGASFRWHQDFQRVYSTSPEPNPEWVFVDASGHEHRWNGGGITNAEWVFDATGWCDRCHDEHEEGHWGCVSCGQQIEPGMRSPNPAGHVIPGMIDGTIEFDDPEGRYMPGGEISVVVGGQQWKFVVRSWANGRVEARGYPC